MDGNRVDKLLVRREPEPAVLVESPAAPPPALS
jgi:hypothetical protein